MLGELILLKFQVKLKYIAEIIVLLFNSFVINSILDIYKTYSLPTKAEWKMTT